jgi:WD40 repeat protein
MISISPLFVLAWLLRGAHSLPNVPTRTQALELHAPAAPAIPTMSLISDFKKNNVSAEWAEGHPKIWGAEERIYGIPYPLGQATVDAALSPDQKFLVLSNGTEVRVIRLDTGEIVSTPWSTSAREYPLVALLSAPGGQYDLIVSRNIYVNYPDPMKQIRLSVEGVPVGQPINHRGHFSAVGTAHFSKDGRRMLTQLDAEVYVSDLDNATYALTLSGHTSPVMSGIFSPDGKSIATTAMDRWTKLWDAQSGKLVHDIGPSDDENLFTLFSPDSKLLLVSNGWSSPAIKLWSIENVPAVVATLGPYNVSIQMATWSPNGDYLALCDFNSMIQILRMSDLKVVQEWKQRESGSILQELVWLEDGKKFAYRVEGGLEVYDFKKNLKYRWGADDFDHYYGLRGKTMVLGSREWIGGLDPDQKVRFWPYPV